MINCKVEDDFIIPSKEDFNFQDLNISCMQSHLAAAKGRRVLGPFYCQHQDLFLASFLKRAIKSYSVATHLFRGIIVIIRKSLRWGTPDSVKLSEWHYVWAYYAGQMILMIHFLRFTILIKVASSCYLKIFQQYKRLSVYKTKLLFVFRTFTLITILFTKLYLKQPSLLKVW